MGTRLGGAQELTFVLLSLIRSLDIRGDVKEAGGCVSPEFRGEVWAGGYTQESPQTAETEDATRAHCCSRRAEAGKDPRRLSTGGREETEEAGKEEEKEEKEEAAGGESGSAVPGASRRRG